MRAPPSLFMQAKTGQRGAAAVEFALVAIPFFLLLLGAVEFGRLMYLWNTVQEVTRNAARQAVVTDFRNNTAIQQSAVFGAMPGPSLLPGAPEITSASVRIRYLNATFGEVVISSGAPNNPTDPGDNITACLDTNRAAVCIRYVEVCMSTDTTCSPTGSIPFAPMISLFSGFGSIKIPLSTVRMPAESLGFTP